ncbi:hypothetical protein D3C76_1807200 [compost metagenome]
MVDEAAKLGELLKLPNLEEDTIKLINSKMRECIGDIKPLTPVQKDEAASVVEEWINGPRKEGGA